MLNFHKSSTHLNWYPLCARNNAEFLTTKVKRVHNIIITSYMLCRHLFSELQFYFVNLERLCLDHAIMVLLADN